MLVLLQRGYSLGGFGVPLNMGQRLSTLKLSLNAREPTMDENRESLLQMSDDVCHKINCINEEIVNAQSVDDHSPKHFENIYSTSTEPTNPTLSDGDDIQSSIASTSSCCAAKQHSRKEYAGDKAKTKLVKKRKKKRNQWVLKFNCARLKSSSSSSGCSEPEVADKVSDECVCTGYRRRAELAASTDEVPAAVAAPASVLSLADGEPTAFASAEECRAEPVIDLSKFNPEDFPIEDCDERARLERAREIAEGVDPPPGFSPKPSELVPQADINMDNLKALLQSALSLSALSQIDVPKSVHTQIDYIHCLVPDLLQITSSSFYWGKMDRYEAERLLENKTEGTFLLRDSAQEEYLFSVSFRKYGRSLHARIEQWNHRFSFDSHDPGVFSSKTVCGLIEHYKDPTCCMFFEPMLTIPLHRNTTFSLQHLCRAVICDHLTYDSISYLKLPKTLKTYLKEYHYKQRVRVRKFETEP
ncbi:hypothetical protein V9T40_001715 [Parthenolecanium corni]|uniref:Suppressor of cytokine signaling 5 n=1 Tax=Parthenolecanium corni TaxID=536013 RepID=A0AAN9Y3Q4_9HEMI